MAKVTTKPPSAEAGQAGTNIVPWTGLSDVDERTPAMQWPRSIPVLDAMRIDSQIAALLQAVTMPIRRYDWKISQGSASDEATQHIARDLALPILGAEDEPLGRTRDRFSFEDYMRHALLDMVFGHMFFEQVAPLGADGKYHLKKLAPRMPATIQKIRVNKFGGLEGIDQYGTGRPGEPPTIKLEVSRLVAHCREREGGNWVGRSALRPLYRHWIRKDRLLRVDAMGIERNGMGVPVIEAPAGATKPQMDKLNAMAMAYKVGEAAGGALPAGARLRLVGVEGTIPSAIESVRYDDEMMAQVFLAMFMKLGTTATGSRALGESMMDFFLLAQEGTATDFKKVTNEHVIEDMIDWNYGVDEGAPLLVFDRSEDQSLSVDEMVQLADKGLLIMDDTLEQYVRDIHNLPKAEKHAPPPAPVVVQPPAPAPPVAARSRRPFVGRLLGLAAGDVPPDRKLQRKLYPHEAASGVDFAALDAAWKAARALLVASWYAIRQQQIDELVGQVEAAWLAGDLTDMASVEATSAGSDLIYEAMAGMVSESAERARIEAMRQGVAMEAADLTELLASTQERADAIAALMARSISEAGARAAVRLAGPATLPADLAVSVRSYLEGLTDSFLNDQLGGALTQAQNAGRMATMVQKPGTYYASELLDSNTCDECARVDGTEYQNLSDAQKEYPTGGYEECEGGIRCRGTIVAVYSEAAPSQPLAS